MRSQFDRQLQKLKTEMIAMGLLCRRAVETAGKALLHGDHAMVKELPELLPQIDQKEREIETVCLQLLLQQQPVARDLRTVSAAMKMVTDMERIGDQSADLAEILAMGHISRIPETLPMEKLTLSVIRMVTDSMDAFVGQDEDEAWAVLRYDDVVDGCFNECKAALLALLQAAEIDGEAMLDLLMISKYFERIGDHAVNIAKWVIFSVTGTIVQDEHAAP